MNTLFEIGGGQVYSLHIHEVSRLIVKPLQRVDQEGHVTRWQSFVFCTRAGECFEVVAFLLQDAPLVRPLAEAPAEEVAA